MIRAIRVLMLPALLALTACATVDDRVPPKEAAQPPAEPEPREAPAEDRAMPEAVLELAETAERDSAAGRHDRAAARLERALRVAPRNAALWQNLAVVRYRQDMLEEAIAMAERSNDYAGADARLRADNWRLIAVARELLGDAGGAAQARKQAASLQPDR